MTAAAYLSPEWIEALDEAAGQHPGIPADRGDLPVTIAYRIVDGPAWYMVVGRDRTRVLAGSVSSPDVWFSTDSTTAGEIHSGNRDPLRAVIDGDLTVGGDPRMLVSNQDVLAALGDLFASARSGVGDL
ncbi:MAG: SCP2 sterol-binding domain-containing protein [Acidimicrobiia bacterium]|nr:SCP2 sterol-binding domain-containing protein [Actinomycetota bacterium]MBL6924103.1 SCP2 sterol-binding domain-containing protein [Acidimicrobiia bacterium]MBL6925910.1 SCP2 sterol-binding domain-containing protein [Acidimicrobiia bacterium]